jgi:hypothetical protein
MCSEHAMLKKPQYYHPKNSTEAATNRWLQTVFCMVKALLKFRLQNVVRHRIGQYVLGRVCDSRCHQIDRQSLIEDAIYHPGSSTSHQVHLQSAELPFLKHLIDQQNAHLSCDPTEFDGGVGARVAHADDHDAFVFVAAMIFVRMAVKDGTRERLLSGPRLGKVGIDVMA